MVNSLTHGAGLQGPGSHPQHHFLLAHIYSRQGSPLAFYSPPQGIRPQIYLPMQASHPAQTCLANDLPAIFTSNKITKQNLFSHHLVAVPSTQSSKPKPAGRLQTSPWRPQAQSIPRASQSYLLELPGPTDILLVEVTYPDSRVSILSLQSHLSKICICLVAPSSSQVL